MSNQYCSIAQLNTFFDIRSLQMLGNDANQRWENAPLVVQPMLDSAGSYLDGWILGRFNISTTLPLPGILTQWCAERAMALLYRRRGEVPKAISAAIEQQDAMLQKLADGEISFAALGVANGPTLVASNSKCGQSQFDNIPDFDLPRSPTAPGGSQSNGY